MIELELDGMFWIDVGLTGNRICVGFAPVNSDPDFSKASICVLFICLLKSYPGSGWVSFGLHSKVQKLGYFWLLIH